MKLYKVKVNGKTYEVEVESITEVESTPEIKKKPRSMMEKSRCLPLFKELC